MSSSPSVTHWLPPASIDDIDVLCLGTGRFLRSVLVPALVGAGYCPALIQTRGRSFLEYMQDKTSYEVDTIEPSGDIKTDQVRCYGAFSLGRTSDKHALVECLPQLKGISILGVGVTEQGLSSKDTPVMKELYDLLHLFCTLIQDGTWQFPNTNDDDTSTITIINMDNLPNNGDLIQSYMNEHASNDDTMKQFLRDRIVFVNTMVDRITSNRENNPMVPSCEPMPKKALVILDPSGSLPPRRLGKQDGVVIRSTKDAFALDIALKLRICNGTHTAIAHLLALTQHINTDVLSNDKVKGAMSYMDSLAQQQILPSFSGTDATAARIAYQDWRQRLLHPHFGMSTFFITQNGPAKGGIRWGPTVAALLSSPEEQSEPLRMSLAFAYAVLLRWLTPFSPSSDPKPASASSACRGWFDGMDPKVVLEESKKYDTGTINEYADGLKYNLDQGWYDFKCNLCDKDGRLLTDLLFKCRNMQPDACEKAIWCYILHPDGGKLEHYYTPGNMSDLESLVAAVSVLYSRFLAGDCVSSVLGELTDTQSAFGLDTACVDFVSTADTLMASKCGRPLYYKHQCIPNHSALMNVPVEHESIPAVVTSEVQSVIAIDLHTHLLPPTHGPLCLWGIDELLTYHYLVAEYFITAPASMTPETFFSLSKQEQAELVWKALFVDRLPLSEACRGVITTLTSLGLNEQVQTRDLVGIRLFYSTFRKDGTEGAERFSEEVFSKAGIEYSIMTNIPFDSNEGMYWKPQRVSYSSRFRSALRVDPLLAGDNEAIEVALKSGGYDVTPAGARQYLLDWCDTMKPEYLMASTPHDFVLPEGTLGGVDPTLRRGVNPDALREPFGFVPVISAQTNCLSPEDEAPSVIDEASDFLSEVLMKVCEERDLPIALKIGAHRGINPALKAAGDGVVAFADAGMLGRLCSRFPNVRFLATFLSRNNQHEACVLASKFRNLHLYGCWWYCNNPSIIREITQMRIELLGTAFTAQHSDARVLDQLLYKWPHSRAVVATVLSEEVSKLVISGCTIVTRRQLRGEVERLFRLSYEEFMEKSLID